MAAPDLSNLRPWLDEHEQYARSIAATDARFDVAHKMLETIALARSSLRPSPDSTANYVHNKEIIEELVTLREKAESVKAKS